MTKDWPDPFAGCTLPAVLDAIGERWAFLILRSAFNGVEHFEEFQAVLGIARNVLADRLARLVEHGIMAREPLAEDRRKIRYTLTDKGEALLPIMVALRQWGDRYARTDPAEMTLVDRRDRRPVEPVAVRSQDGRTLGWHEMIWARADERPEPRSDQQ